MAKRDNRKAARALAEWSLTNFKYNALPTIAKNYSVADRTIERWYAELDNGGELSDLFKEYRNELTKSQWASQIDETLSVILTRMRALAADSIDLPELTLAFEKVADVSLAKEIILHEYNAEQSAEISEGVTQTESENPANYAAN